MAWSFHEVFEGQTATGQGLYWTEVTRRFYVVDMTTADVGMVMPINITNISPRSAIDRLMYSGYPAWHCCDSYGYLRAVHYSAEMLGPTAACVTIGYANTLPKYYRGGCGLEIAKTDLDKPEGGSQIVLTHDGITQAGTIEVFAPLSVLTVTRIEAAQGSGAATWTDPIALSMQYVGCVNSTSFLGAAPRTLLCESIGFDDNGMEGIAWSMTYTFRHKPYGWDPWAVFMIDGEPAYNAVVGQGRKQIEYYPEADFTALNLK